MARDSDKSESPVERAARLLRQAHERLDADEKESRRNGFFGEKIIIRRYKSGELFEIEMTDSQTLR